MIRGRRPVPKDIREIFKPGTLVALEPQDNGAEIAVAPSGPMIATARLAEDAAALEYFEFFVGTAGTGHLKPIDQPLLERLCFYYALFDRTADAYSKIDLVQQMEGKDGPGLMVKSPHFDMLMRLGETIRRLTVELSLTPTERTRVSNASKGGIGEKELLQREELKKKFLSGAMTMPLPQG